MKRTLILGYGNPDREDDGVAWHILTYLARRTERTIPISFQEGFYSSGLEPDMMFVLQLTPELAETAAEYDRLCLVDAHTGSAPADVNVELVQPVYQTSPFTHHLTGQSLLALVQTLYHKMPETILVSVRGYRFGFTNELSDETASLARQAEQVIWEWVQKE